MEKRQARCCQAVLPAAAFLRPAMSFNQAGPVGPSVPPVPKTFAFLQLEKRKCAKKKLEKRKVKPM